MKKTYQNILAKPKLDPPSDWMQMNTIDMHTGGEPLRVILDGFPKLQGDSVLAYRNYCRENYDQLRTALMFEPRGHADMYGCILTPPNDDKGDFGVIFLHNEGYSTMCGHAIIALATLAVKLGWKTIREGENTLKIDAPCGRITATVNVHNNEVQDVRFLCVPSFVVGLDYKINIDGLGEIIYDLAYGGAFYAYVDLRKNDFNFKLETKYLDKLISAGRRIKQAVIAHNPKIEHPFENDLSFLYGTIFIDRSIKPEIHSKNVCIFADGEVDRCPTGSGVSGRMAIENDRKQLKQGESIAIEGITGSVFKGKVAEEITYGTYKAVIPEVSGKAFVTGQHTFLIDPKDPFKTGFLLR